ncbi:hypothetical protein ATJ93_4295 [Halopiger aswanensis]|uniref:Uncharacterized protein n=1 Tax=Halopiger aswanensis TaxID=148449 RepID=A0A3R7GFE7_9EURY|nr:hypothetical protein ATJ93_4295 [Halopiger aswanensis]
MCNENFRTFLRFYYIVYISNFLSPSSKCNRYGRHPAIEV